MGGKGNMRAWNHSLGEPCPRTGLKNRHLPASIRTYSFSKLGTISQRMGISSMQRRTMETKTASRLSKQTVCPVSCGGERKLSARRGLLGLANRKNRITAAKHSFSQPMGRAVLFVPMGGKFFRFLVIMKIFAGFCLRTRKKVV